MDESFDNLIQVAEAAARAAGQEALRVQKSAAFGKQFKPDGSPVTDGDKQAERKIIDVIRSAYPHHRLNGEEYGKLNEESDSPYLWVFDPIDGTWAFLNRENTAAVSLALLREGEPVLGVVYNPFTEEMYLAAENKTSTLNGVELPITRRRLLRHCVMDYRLDKPFRADIDVVLNIWMDHLVAKLISMGGSIVYALAQVAKGAHNVFVMGCVRPPDPWDLTAGVLLVKRAGGAVTDLAGNEINPLVYSEYLVATSQEDLHGETLQTLNRYGLGRR
ncbi:MAG TPA: inositol monophosphatase [Blastocatellia bacterium]|nr:inositol monophosphatase [Blastocatellia bacterium]